MGRSYIHLQLPRMHSFCQQLGHGFTRATPTPTDASACHWCGRLLLFKFVHMQMQLGRCDCSRRTEVPDIGVCGCSSSSSFTCKCSSDAAIAAGGQKCLTLVCAVAPLQVRSHANAARTLRLQQEDISA